MSEISDAKRLKILIIPSGYPTEKNPVESIFFRAHAEAVSIYDDVTVIHPYCSTHISIFHGIFKVKNRLENNIRVIYIEYCKVPKKLSPFLFFAALFYAFSKFNRDIHFDVIHAHKAFPAGISAILIGNLYKIPVIITEHSSNFSHTMRNFPRRKTIKYAMEKATKVIAVSKFLVESIKKFKINADIEVIPNPVSIKNFTPSPKKSKDPLLKKILHVSSLNTYKGIPYLLKALAKLKDKRTDFFVDIVGGDSNYVRKYQDYIKKYDLAGFIKFHGKKSHDEIARFMRSCNFFVLPSLRESFGVVLIEAMACGKPLITTKCGGPEEIVTDKTGILIPPGDVEALVSALNYMLDNFYKFDAQYISQYAKEHFSYEVVGKATDRVYRECLD